MASHFCFSLKFVLELGTGRKDTGTLPMNIIYFPPINLRTHQINFFLLIQLAQKRKEAIDRKSLLTIFLTLGELSNSSTKTCHSTIKPVSIKQEYHTSNKQIVPFTFNKQESIINIRVLLAIHVFSKAMV